MGLAYFHRQFSHFIRTILNPLGNIRPKILQKDQKNKFKIRTFFISRYCKTCRKLQKIYTQICSKQNITQVKYKNNVKKLQFVYSEIYLIWKKITTRNQKTFGKKDSENMSNSMPSTPH